MLHMLHAPKLESEREGEDLCPATLDMIDRLTFLLLWPINAKKRGQPNRLPSQNAGILDHYPSASTYNACRQGW